MLDIPKFNLPNILTLVRLVCSPLFLPFLIVYLLPFNVLWVNCLVGLFFSFFSLTDFFDGYLARKFKQETALGRVLDPIADKFLLFATLVSLLAAGKIFFFWVIILIAREFFIMGLRQIALEHNFSVKVSMLGKVKTMLQAITLLLIIVNPYQSQGLFGAPGWNAIELALLILTMAVAVISAERYYQSFVQLFKAQLQHDNELFAEQDDGANNF